MRKFEDVHKEAKALKNEADRLHVRFMQLCKLPETAEVEAELRDMNAQLRIISIKMRDLAMEARAIRRVGNDLDYIY